MNYKSRGKPQYVARVIQEESLKAQACEIVWIEKGIDRRQEILKHSNRKNKGIVRISKRARELHGNKF